MAENELGEVRRSAIIMNYGPGAVIDFRLPGSGAPMSVISGGLEAWDDRASAKALANEQTVNEPRLEKKLGVQGFRLPPVTPDPKKPTIDVLLGVPFPDWLQCPSCDLLRRYTHWAGESGDPARYCAECSAEQVADRNIFVVPPRFVVVCEKGHIDDFPWHVWVKHNSGCENRKTLKLEAKGAGLAGLILSCPKCKAYRPMENIFKSGALAGLKCMGRRPWLPEADESCDYDLTTAQRGASNLYFPQILSAIDIPPWSDSVQKSLGQYWQPLTQVIGGVQARRNFLEPLWPLLGITDRSIDEVARAVEQRIGLLDDPERLNLRWDEYQQFCLTENEIVVDEEFDIRPESVPDGLNNWVSRVVRVVRLREVRALRGFTRILPTPGARTNGGNGPEIELAPLSEKKPNWLPAVEVRGEGIFIELNSERLQEWMEASNVLSRIGPLIDTLIESRALYDDDKEHLSPELGARFWLIHTFAHVLMRQLSLQSGYSSASLRERLFVGNHPDAANGLLIYTASPDSDGTLGGLQRLGEINRFEPIIRQAIAGVAWCSSDPLCIEGLSASSEPSNLAACHSCVLASETSCEEFNQFLDRALLVGTPDEPELGFFSGLKNDLEPD